MNADNINERIKYDSFDQFIELNMVDNETDALLLENNFIKTLKPKLIFSLGMIRATWIALSESKFPRIFVCK